MTRWTLVPMRGLAEGKSRLAGVLDGAARWRLNRLLLERVLEAVARAETGLARCVVASACDDALDLADRRGALALRERPGTGLNAALEGARDVARRQGATSILTLAADLPDVTGASLRRLLAHHDRDAAVIIPDRHGSGTNGLLIPADCALRFAFGAGSFGRHVAALRDAHLAASVWRDPALAFDLDTPDDYATWRERSAAYALHV